MIGLDTNVLVRYLVQDDPGQSRKATQVIAKRCTRDDLGFINRIVLCELVWVLKSASGYSIDTIVPVLEKLLRTSQLKTEDKPDRWFSTASVTGLGQFHPCCARHAWASYAWLQKIRKGLADAL